MRRAVLWDSSAILALLDADDTDHALAAKIAGDIAHDRRPSFITNYVEVEAHALLLRKLGRALAREWLLGGGLPVVRSLAVAVSWGSPRDFTVAGVRRRHGALREPRRGAVRTRRSP